VSATQVSQSVAPETTRTRPSGSGVAVGYQRGKVIGAPVDHDRVTGSKMVVSVVPSKERAPWPPNTAIRPSASDVCAAQKMLLGLGTSLKTRLVGFQTYASCPDANAPHISTSPVRISTT